MEIDYEYLEELESADDEAMHRSIERERHATQDARANGWNKRLTL